MTHCFPNQRIPFPLQSPSLRLETFLSELKSICLSNHYFSSPKWYWGSIIMYLHTDILFDDAINMCFSLSSHTCLLLAEACFWSVISVSSSRLIGIALISDSPSIAQYSHTALWPPHGPVPPVLRGIGRSEGVANARSSGEVRGCHWKHAIFYIFAPCHQIRMRCSDRRVLRKHKPAWVSIPTKSQLYKCIDDDDGTSKANSKVCGDTASYVENIWVWFFSTYAVSVEPFQCNVLFLCVFVVSFFPLFPSLPPHPSLGAASCPVQAERRARKLPIWPCPWPCVFFLCHSHSPHL